MPEQRNQSGMTLVEILVAMVIMGIIITGIYNLFRVHNLMAAKQEETTMMQQELLSAMTDMSEELRMCGFSTNVGASFGFNASGTSDTSVYCTRAISTNNPTNIIAYTRNATGNTIMHISPTNEWVDIASNISDLRFSYFDQDGAEISNINATNVEQVRMIEINATAIPSEARSKLGISSRNMHTRVWVRNLSFN